MVKASTARRRTASAAAAAKQQRAWKRRRRKHMALPAGFQSGGRRYATLAEVMDPACPTMDGADLSEEQLARLTVTRIRRQKTFVLGLLGGGTISKRRAIAEVRSGSMLGRFLIEVEARTIALARETFSARPPSLKSLKATNQAIEGLRRA